MPPKAKITRELILSAALEITREVGFRAVNARSVAAKLQCSTRPIFTCYENMEALKIEFLAFAYAYYERYVERYRSAVPVSPLLLLPLSYIEFAREETYLFRLLFISDMDLNMTEASDFYRDPGNEAKALAFASAAGLEPARAKTIFLKLFLFTHGLAVLTATKKIALGHDDAKQMVSEFLSAFIGQEKPDWSPNP